MRSKLCMHFLSHSWEMHQDGTIDWIQVRPKCGMMVILSENDGGNGGGVEVPVREDVRVERSV